MIHILIRVYRKHGIIATVDLMGKSRGYRYKSAKFADASAAETIRRKPNEDEVEETPQKREFSYIHRRRQFIVAEVIPSS